MQIIAKHWAEALIKTPEYKFNVAPVVLDGKQKIFNLAVMSRDWSKLNELEEERVHCWLKLLVLMIAKLMRMDVYLNQSISPLYTLYMI